MYQDMRNCMECGRLVTPSSGLSGPLESNIFCSRKCLRSYYDEHPGSWEDEEQIALVMEQRKQEQEEQNRLMLEQWKLERQEKERRNFIIRWSIFLLLLLLIFTIGNVWIWLTFICYLLWMFIRWSNS